MPRQRTIIKVVAITLAVMCLALAVSAAAGEKPAGKANPASSSSSSSSKGSSSSSEKTGPQLFWETVDGWVEDYIVVNRRAWRLAREYTAPVRKLAVYKTIRRQVVWQYSLVSGALQQYASLPEDSANGYAAAILTTAISVVVGWSLVDFARFLIRLPYLQLRSPVDTVRLVGNATLFAAFSVLSTVAMHSGEGSLSKLVTASPWLVRGFIAVVCSNFFFHSLRLFSNPSSRINFWNVMVPLIAISGLKVPVVASRTLLESVAIAVLTSKTAVTLSAYIYAVLTGLTMAQLAFIFNYRSTTPTTTGKKKRRGQTIRVVDN